MWTEPSAAAVCFIPGHTEQLNLSFYRLRPSFLVLKCSCQTRQISRGLLTVILFVFVLSP